MPIYEYQCESCGHRLELIQQRSDAPLAECPKCHGAVKKLLAAPALQFKGSGFYITDYSAKGKEKSPETPADKKTSETKPASESGAAPKTTAADKKSDGGSGTPAPPPKSEGTGSA